MNELRTLKKENDLRLNSVSHKNQQALTKLCGYFNLKNVGAFDREILRKELIGMSLEADTRGESLDDSIDDKKKWCREMSESLNKQGAGEFIISTAKSLVNFITIMFLLSLCLYTNGNFPFSAFHIVLIAAIFIYSVFIDKPLSAKYIFESGTKKLIPKAVGLLPFVLFLIIGAILNGILSPVNLPAIPTITISIILLLVVNLSYELYMQKISKNYNWKD